MWDNYPESVRLIRLSFRVLAGNPVYMKMGGQTGGKCNVGDPALHRGCQAMACLRSRETRCITGFLWRVRRITTSTSPTV